MGGTGFDGGSIETIFVYGDEISAVGSDARVLVVLGDGFGFVVDFGARGCDILPVREVHKAGARNRSRPASGGGSPQVHLPTEGALRSTLGKQVVDALHQTLHGVGESRVNAFDEDTRIVGRGNVGLNL